MTNKNAEKQDEAQVVAPAETINEEGKTPPKPQFSKQELLAIFDDMIFAGEYTEEVTIKGRLKVTFRSRSVEETTSITKDIDSKNFTLMSSLSEHRALLNLAHSLVKYDNKDLSDLDIEARKARLNKLPAVIVGALSEALVKFDAKIAAACLEGEENF